MLPLYYYNKVEIASVFHIHVCRMWKTHRSLHHHPRRGRACPARALSHNHPLTFQIVGRGLDPSACPFPAGTRSPFHPPCRGRACPARNLPVACRQSSTARPFPKPPDPATRFPPTTPIICTREPPSPQYTPCPNFTLKLCQKNQKNLQKPVDKGHTTCYNNQAVSRAQPAAAAAGAFTYSLYAVF